MILLDTHVLVWMFQEPDRLGKATRALIEDEPDGGFGVSAITAWEIGLLVGRDRLELGRPVEVWLDRVQAQRGIHAVALTSAMALDAATLPGRVHRDHADRLLIATARALGAPLMTADRAILDYAGQGHVRVVDARH